MYIGVRFSLFFFHNIVCLSTTPNLTRQYKRLSFFISDFAKLSHLFGFSNDHNHDTLQRCYNRHFFWEIKETRRSLCITDMASVFRSYWCHCFRSRVGRFVACFGGREPVSPTLGVSAETHQCHLSWRRPRRLSSIVARWHDNMTFWFPNLPLGYWERFSFTSLIYLVAAFRDEARSCTARLLFLSTYPQPSPSSCHPSPSLYYYLRSPPSHLSLKCCGKHSASQSWPRLNLVVSWSSQKRNL